MKKLIVSPNLIFYTFGSADAISRAVPNLLVAQVAGCKAARADGRALDATLLDGGLHAHAILRMPRAHLATSDFSS